MLPLLLLVVAADPPAHWAYRPVTPPAVPTPADAGWPRTDLDRFVRHRQEAAGLTPGPDADPLALVRRLTFDLTGLPPTLDEAAEFVAAAGRDRPAAVAALVDRLLASRGYAERWGRHWLDVARYAESSGKDVNVLYPHAWRYRDYVIDAYARDVPFDRFLTEQIAGDLLPAKTDSERSRLTVATGFLAVGPKGLNEASPRQYATDQADEQAHAVGVAFLAQTVGCARCHDHKFDPISQADYTALAGVFLSTETRFGTPGGVQGRNATKLVELPAGTVVARGLTAAERAAKQMKLDDLLKQRRELLAARAGGKTPKDGMTNFDVVRVITQAAQLEAELAGLNPDGSPKPQAMGVADKPAVAPPAVKKGGRQQPSGFETAADSPRFARGNVAAPKETVPRGAPAILCPDAKPVTAGSGRLELARGLASPTNPLTARVYVNRVWHWLFGRGLVASVDNFGTTGEAPSHPELLDHLAARFVADGWSTKKLIRAIVTSRTYQLSAAHAPAAFATDPGNALLWRHSPRRLEAEEVRDAMLVAAGALARNPPAGSLVGRAGDGPVGGPRAMALTEQAVASADHDYRSVYLPVVRGVPAELLGAFDRPDAAEPCGGREATNVPAQALVLLNGEFAAKQSARLGELLAKLPAAERAEAAFRRTLGRPPTAAEAEAATRLAGRYPDGWASVARGLFAAAEFRLID